MSVSYFLNVGTLGIQWYFAESSSPWISFLLFRDDKRNSQLLKVDILLQGPTYHIIFSDSQEVPPPFMIDNQAEVPVLYFQTKTQEDRLRTTVKPFTSGKKEKLPKFNLLWMDEFMLEPHSEKTCIKNSPACASVWHDRRHQCFLSGKPQVHRSLTWIKKLWKQSPYPQAAWWSQWRP